MAETFPFRPFKPGEQVDNPDGTHSTERTRTVMMNGGWATVPSLWMSADNMPVDLGHMSDDQLAAFAGKYERLANKKFPRRRASGPADAAAEARSAAGGVNSGSPLARDTVAGGSRR